MKAYHFYDAPLKVCGLPFYHGEKELRRLPQALIDTLGLDGRIGTRPPCGCGFAQTRRISRCT